MTNKKVSPLATALAAEIRRIRIKRKYTQGEVARRAGLNPSNYNRMEQGQQDIRVSTFLRIVGAMGLKLEFKNIGRK